MALVTVGLLLWRALRLQRARMREDRRRLSRYAQQLAVERQLDALTRATIAAMRRAVRDTESKRQ